MISALYPTTGSNGLWVFVLVTLLLGGGAAVATGRALATTWRPMWQVIGGAVVLAAAVRFLQYALFGQPFLTLAAMLVDTGILALFALAGFRHTRARQMATRYPWAFEPTGFAGWRRRAETMPERAPDHTA